jgi:hypothetical protein
MQINLHNWFRMQQSCWCCWMSDKKEFVLTSYTSWVIHSLFYSPKPCRSALRFTEPLIQRVPASIPGNKATGFEWETDSSTAPIAEVKKDLNPNFNPPAGLHGVERKKFAILIASENNVSSVSYDETFLKYYLFLLVIEKNNQYKL